MPTSLPVQFPKLYIAGFSGTSTPTFADVNSSSQLMTGGGVGTTTLAMGSKSAIAGPSGNVAAVDSNGNLQTTNG